MTFSIKICGLNTPHALAAALEAEADMIGLVFHEKSPRFVTMPIAADLADEARGRASIVALVADADDRRLAAIDEAVAPDFWQLHGSECPTRLADIRSKFGKPVIKALGVARPDDLEAVALYTSVADTILLDAKPPRAAAYPGGHGTPFDWAMLRALDPGLAFMLSGGLTPETVGDAIRSLFAMKCRLVGVDVSSGVERAPGHKSVEKIKRFVAEARAAAQRARSI